MLPTTRRGTMDDWAANDADFAKMVGWTEALPSATASRRVWSLCHAELPGLIEASVWMKSS